MSMVVLLLFSVTLTLFMGFMGIVVVFREWLFNDVAKSWMFIDFKKNLKIRLSSVGQTYLVYTILHVHV